MVDLSFQTERCISEPYKYEQKSFSRALRVKLELLVASN